MKKKRREEKETKIKEEKRDGREKEGGRGGRRQRDHYLFWDIVDLVPDHHNKANNTIKQVTQIFLFLFPSAYKGSVCTIDY